ncbi:cytochrome b5 domain-containing protein [Clostridium carnis]
MEKKSFLEEKFIELNKLKGMLVTYPEEYKNNIVEVMERVCKQIDGYLHSGKRCIKENEILRQEFTIEELAKYNGKDGMPAYIAIKGTVYDTTDIMKWSGGEHFGVKAGGDRTAEFLECHKGNMENLKKLRIVGTITQ